MDIVTRNLIADTIYYSLFLLAVIAFFLIIQKLVELWAGYKNKEWFLTREYTVLEIRIPKEVTKSPVAMELFFTALNEGGGNGNWYETLTTGKTRPVFSYELVSTEGKVHFYVRTEKKFKPRIEANLYAHYPSVEIVEVPDYSRMIDFQLGPHGMFGLELALTQDDPIPIKTYKVFNQDKTGVDEEEKINPIAQTIETLASMGPGEHMWSQIVVRAHKKEVKVDASWKDRRKALKEFFQTTTYKFKSEDAIQNARIFLFGKKWVDWKAEGKNILEKYGKEQKLGAVDDEGKPKKSTVTTLTPEEKNMLEALENNLSKPAYDVGMRVMYIADSDKFRPGERISMAINLYKQYSSDTYNAFKPGLLPGFDYPWQDRSGKTEDKIKTEMLRDYRRREFFFSEKTYPHGKKGYPTFVLSTEEMATIYHLPGSVVQAPTFDRIDSATVQAPSNLPI